MLWPVVIPFKITFWGAVALVILATLASALRKRKPIRTLFSASGIALVAFIPSCAAVQHVVDARRFGVFEYASFDDVQDFRIERFLPTKARAITLEKKFIGHRARYSISESDLIAYLDQLWGRYGQYSAIPRSDLPEGEPVSQEEIQLRVDGLDRPPLKDAVQYHSPVEADGGGAIYYFDRASGTAYHWAAYW